MIGILLRIVILLLVETIAFYFMIPSNFNITHLPSFFLLWALISFILFGRKLSDLSIFSSLGMLGRGSRSAVDLAGEAAERMVGTNRERYKFFRKFKIHSKDFAYLVVCIINLLLYLIIKLFI
ncbi:hypothetical protein R9X47_01590 [Wukongibacter baidiensis]|uniref:hypothetical protein n=1 Tax=Wukongibacter baidiensis TaxID=1723361 RepID=UPI003D7F7BB5